jgi:DNA polymerase IIIc chi subunit
MQLQLATLARMARRPHGTASDGNADLQPVWITDNDENPNHAHVCFLVGSAKAGRFCIRSDICLTARMPKR